MEGQPSYAENMEKHSYGEAPSFKGQLCAYQKNAVNISVCAIGNFLFWLIAGYAIKYLIYALVVSVPQTTEKSQAFLAHLLVTPVELYAASITVISLFLFAIRNFWARRQAKFPLIPLFPTVNYSPDGFLPYQEENRK